MKHLSVMAVLVTGLVISGCSGSKAKVDTPDGAIRNMQQAIIDSKPEQIYTALPASYQADVDALVADAATRMDTEIWKESTALIKQAVGLLESKRELLLSSPMMANVPNKADVEKNWDTGVALIKSLVNSELLDIERLRQGNVKDLLTGDGAAIMAKMVKLMENSESSAKAGDELAKLKKATVSVVSQDGDVAVVKVEAPEEEPESIDMVKVEGVWIPKEMADGFKDGIADARKKVATIDFTSEEGKQKKAMIMMQIGAVKPMLDQLEAAKTQEDLQAVFSGVMMMMMGGMQQGGSAAMPPQPME